MICHDPRLEALAQLLAKPDPPDLPRRASRVTQAGAPDRHRAIPQLILRWAQYYTTMRMEGLL